jgi:hypothetical protein
MVICVPSVIDVQNKDRAAFVIDAIADSVLTTARAPKALKGSPQGCPDTAGVRSQRPVDERPRRESGIGGKSFAQCSPGPGRQVHIEGLELANRSDFFTCHLRWPAALS